MSDRDMWRRDYLTTVMDFLRSNNVFDGGKLCEWCRSKGLREPHHHNEWVSMPQMLLQAGHIKPLGKCRPSTHQTNIESVTLWQSLIFNPSLAIQGSLF